MPLPCLTACFAHSLHGLRVCRTSAEGQGTALAPFLLRFILRETQPSVCRGLMWLKRWKWSLRFSFHSLNCVSHKSNRQARRALEKQLVHGVQIAWSLVVLLSFLKKKQRERKGERRKRWGENRRERKAQSLCASAALKYVPWEKFPPSSITKMAGGTGSIHRKHFALNPFKLLHLVSFILTSCTPTPGVSTWTSASSCSFLL